MNFENIDYTVKSELFKVHAALVLSLTSKFLVSIRFPFFKKDALIILTNFQRSTLIPRFLTLGQKPVI